MARTNQPGEANVKTGGSEGFQDRGKSKSNSFLPEHSVNDGKQNRLRETKSLTGETKSISPETSRKSHMGAYVQLNRKLIPFLIDLCGCATMRIWLALVWRADKRMSVEWSEPGLREDAKVSRAALFRGLSELVDRKLIRRAGSSIKLNAAMVWRESSGKLRMAGMYEGLAPMKGRGSNERKANRNAAEEKAS